MVRMASDTVSTHQIRSSDHQPINPSIRPLNMLFKCPVLVQATCVDMNFQELWMSAYAQGVDLMLWPSAYGGGLNLRAYAAVFGLRIIPAGTTMQDLVYRTTLSPLYGGIVLIYSCVLNES